MKYMFRKTLLEEHGIDAVHDLINYCQRYQIDSCMIVTESHDQHPFPRTLQELDVYCQGILSYTINKLKEAGIEAGINVWFTLGCEDFGKDFRRHPQFGWENYVDWQGRESRVVASPLSTTWREYVYKAFALFATTRPDYIFVDDDFRLHNHGTCGLGSFDPLMLQRFSQELERRVDRKEAVDLILGSFGPGSPREKWFQVQNQTLVEAAQIIRDAVSSVDPKIQVGLMSSDPAVHSAEGRRWQELFVAFAGENRILNRPCMFGYRQLDFRALAMSYFFPLLTRKMLGEDARYCAEVENALGGLFAKSATMLRAQMRLAILAGCQDIALNLYDFVGQPLGENSAFDNILLEEKPVLQTIQKEMVGTHRRGIQVVVSEKAALAVASPTNYDDLVVKHSWENVLSLLGFPATYDEDQIKALTGELVRLIPQKIIQKWLEGAVLLDGSAARALSQMGHGDLIGLDVNANRVQALELGNEQIIDPGLGPVGRRLATRHLLGESYLYRLIPRNKARVMSVLWYDLNQQFGPGMVWYENELGGRIATIAYDGQSDCLIANGLHSDAVTFRSALRQTIFQNTLSFLARGQVPVKVRGGADIMPIRLDGEGHSIIALQSLHSDLFIVEAKVSRLPTDVKNVWLLTQTGIWEEYRDFKSEQNNLSLFCELAHGECKVFKVE